MSNHYHLVLYVNESELANLTHNEICERWSTIYSLSPIVARWQKGELSSDAQKEMALSIIAKKDQDIHIFLTELTKRSGHIWSLLVPSRYGKTRNAYQKACGFFYV